MVHVRQRGHTDKPGSWELAPWIRRGGVSAQMSRGWPTELARAIYGRRDALARNADFPAWEKGYGKPHERAGNDALANRLGVDNASEVVRKEPIHIVAIWAVVIVDAVRQEEDSEE